MWCRTALPKGSPWDVHSYSIDEGGKKESSGSVMSPRENAELSLGFFTMGPLSSYNMLKEILGA